MDKETDANLTGSNKEKRRTTGSYVAFAVAFIVAYVAANLLTGYLFNRPADQQSAQNTVNRVENYYASTSTWKQFDSAIGHFQALFPAYPQHQTQSVSVHIINATLAFDMYTSQDASGTTYLIGTTVYPSSTNISNPENNLEGALNGLITAVKGSHLVSSNITNFESYKAVEFLVQNNTVDPGNIIYIKGRVMLVGYRMYMEEVLYQESNYRDSDYNEFMKSFTLTGS
jgi:hypothetical protein